MSSEAAHTKKFDFKTFRCHDFPFGEILFVNKQTNKNLILRALKFNQNMRHKNR